MDTYPVIYVPKSLSEISKSTPYDNISKPDYSPPKRPKMPFKLWQEEMEKEKLNNPSVGMRFVRIFVAYPLLALLAGFALFWPLFMMDGTVDKIAFMIINIMILVIGYAYTYFTDETRLIRIEHQNEILDYEKELKVYKLEYDKEQAIYERIKSEIESYKKSDKYLKTLKLHRKYLYDQFINEVEKPTLRIKNQTRGISEKYFLRYLNEYFKGFIKTDLSIAHEYLAAQRAKDNVYIPDFIFMKDGLPIIDIELDEPYSASNGEPIHYVTSDDNRDQFFEDKNWIIIRFAEEQTIKEPIECCYVIAETIYRYSKDDTFVNKFDSFEYPKEIERWKYHDAYELALLDYRNTYLPDHMQHSSLGLI